MAVFYAISTEPANLLVEVHKYKADADDHEVLLGAQQDYSLPLLAHCGAVGRRLGGEHWRLQRGQGSRAGWTGGLAQACRLQGWPGFGAAGLRQRHS
jgi:hypothetical protein